VRYLRCPSDHLPSTAELQLLVPHSGAASREQPGAEATSSAITAPMSGALE
jgi:hypothetical protein